MLSRGFRSFSNTTATTPSFSSFCRLLSSSKNVVPSSAAPAVVDSDDEETLPPRSSGALSQQVTPSLLFPRVVVYDGVCHLCHRGTSLESLSCGIDGCRTFLFDSLAEYGERVDISEKCLNDVGTIGVKWVINADKDKKIKFCCVQSKAAEPYLTACGLEKKDVLRRLLFVEVLGSYSQGSTAALRVASYLPLPYSALSTLLVVPRPIRDSVYDYIAKNRYKWFGRAEACLVLPEKALIERFIDWDELSGK